MSESVTATPHVSTSKKVDEIDITHNRDDGKYHVVVENLSNSYDNIIKYVTKLFIEQNRENVTMLRLDSVRNDDSVVGEYVKLEYEIPHDTPVVVNYSGEDISVVTTQITEYISLYNQVTIVQKAVLTASNRGILEKLIKAASLQISDTPGIYKFDPRSFMGWKRYCSISKRDEATLILPSSIQDLYDDIENFTNSKSLYEKFGHPYKRNYLLFGKPGTGKTSIAKVIAQKTNRDIYTLTLDDQMTDAKLAEAFAYINPVRPAIFLLEDIDSITQERDVKSGVTFSALLNILDGAASIKSLITIITANHINKLDEALIRPGRIDMIIEFGKISENQIRQLCKLYEIELSENAYQTLIELSDKNELVPAIFSGFMFRHLMDSSRKKKHLSDVLNNETYVKLFKQYLKEIKDVIKPKTYKDLYT